MEKAEDLSHMKEHQKNGQNQLGMGLLQKARIVYGNILWELRQKRRKKLKGKRQKIITIFFSLEEPPHL
jgi:hypothetical protein